MPLLIPLSIILQFICLLHCMKTGRERWAWILVIGSYVAVAAYFFVEILPGLRNDPTARRVLTNVKRKLDPERDRRRIAEQLELNDSIDNRRRLAEESAALGDHGLAAELYQRSLSGLYVDDPHLLLGLARAQLELREPQKARESLERLIAAHPDFRSADGHFLFARALTDLGEFSAADKEFQALLPGYSGEDARLYYARSLLGQNRRGEAKNMFEEIVNRARLSPRYYRKAQSEFIHAAERELKALGS